MRVCSPQLTLESDSALGGVVYDRELLIALAARGVELEIPMVKIPSYPHPATWRCHQLPLKSERRLGTAMLQGLYLSAMWQIWRRCRFDAIRVFNLRYSGAPAVVFSSLTNVPVIAHVHHLDPEESRLARRLSAWLAGRSDAVIVDSAFGSEQVVSQYGLSRSPNICGAGVDRRYVPLPPDEARRSALGFGSGIIFMTLSVIRRRKNIESLIRAFARLDCAHSWLLICGAPYGGDRSYYSELKALTSSLMVSDRVRFVGHVSEEEKVQLLNLADVFVFPSLLEGFGMAVAEAMSCGKPVIVSRSGSLPELVDSATGRIVEATDIEQIAGAMRELVMCGPVQRRRMGVAALERSAAWRWDTTARKVLDAVSTAKERRR